MREISESKVWFKIEQFNHTAHEVELDMHTNAALNRISVTTDHTLTIHNITMEDSGQYYCQGLQGQEAENMFNYIIDSEHYYFKYVMLILECMYYCIF